VNGEILAEVHRVLRGDSERALVHAVDGDGLEYRIELPERAVREVADGRGYTLRLSWSLEANTNLTDAQSPTPGQLSEVGPQAQPTSPAPERRTPAEIDAAFMALMKGIEGRPTAAPTGLAPAPGSTSDANTSSPPAGVPDSAMQLASRLGLKQPEPAAAPQPIE